MRANDPYRTLGISSDATREEIRRAYRTLVFSHHPDANPGDLCAEARFREIQGAYERLMKTPIGSHGKARVAEELFPDLEQLRASLVSRLGSGIEVSLGKSYLQVRRFSPTEGFTRPSPPRAPEMPQRYRATRRGFTSNSEEVDFS